MQVNIIVNVTEKTKNVVFHAVDLAIDKKSTSLREYSLNNNNSKFVQIANQQNDSAREFFIIRTSDFLKAGKQYILYLKFVGYLNDFLEGFYRSSYIVQNQTRFVFLLQLCVYFIRFIIDKRKKLL